MTTIINKDTATDEFDRFMKSMGLVVAKADEDMRETVIDSISNVSLFINDDGEAVYTPQNKRSRYRDPITFRERSGADLAAMGKKGKNENPIAQMYAGMASMTGLPPATFTGLVGVDCRVCEALFTLLMA